MSIVCTALRQAVSSAVGSSSDESGAGIFDTGSSSIDPPLGPERHDADFRIRQRLEASRQGMLQLEALRNKHQKLMQEMRIRWPHSHSRVSEKGKHDETSPTNSQIDTIFVELQCEKSNNGHAKNEKLKTNDSRSASPVSCCVSHRSSMSMDSGCFSLSSDPSSQTSIQSTFGKLFADNQPKKNEENITITEMMDNENPRLVATAIESTTAMRCHGPRRYAKNLPRPKSMYSSYPEENAVAIDALSFSQITPPPVHRKFTAVARSESVQACRSSVATSCTEVCSPMSPSPAEKSPTHFPVNQSPVLHAKPINIPLSTKIPTSPYMRLRNPQKPPHNSQAEGQALFHASRIYVDRSSYNMPLSKQCLRYDSDDESPRPLRAQPAIVLSRQQSYGHSNESSPCELRKLHFMDNSAPLPSTVSHGYHQQLNRCESSLSTETTVPERSRRRMKEKDWKESEGL